MSFSSEFQAPQFINPLGLYDPSPNGYSHVSLVQTPGRLIHIAGQGGENSAGELASDFETQLQQALGNLGHALSAADARLADVLKLTVLIVAHSAQRLQLLSEHLRAAWGEAPLPACTLIPVPCLALEGMLVEIDAVAATALPSPAAEPLEALRRSVA